MKPDVVIVRLGELTLKGKNRHRFERTVVDQLKRLLSSYPSVAFNQEFGRIHIELNGTPYEAVEQSLNKIFGLASYSPAVQVPLDLETIRQTALQLVQERQDTSKTFKVIVKRANKSFEFDSQQVAVLVGGYVLHSTEGLKVDLHHPDTELYVDIRNKCAYLFTSIIRGTGGYPVGSNGRALLMLSGGIDSPVAGWLSMRRGLAIEAVHFHSYPYTSERAQQKVKDLSKLLSQYAERIVLHMVPFTDIQIKLREDCRENLLVTCMKRAMLRIAEGLAEKRGAMAVVTGESLGQVASQTLPSLDVIGRVANLPLLRPLIMMDKAEIIAVAEKIGTYEISIQPYEDCCTLFLPKSPATNPSLRIVEQLEEKMEWLDEAIEQAIANTERLRIHWDEKDAEDMYF